MKYYIIFLFCFIHECAFAQRKLPVIQAKSVNVSINDGGYLDKNAWTLAPQAKPDIYMASRSSKPKWVTFYTDIDSIKVKLKPGKNFDFIILLNGKDSCFTRIESTKPAALPQKTGRIDSIPFILNEYEAIQVKSIINEKDTLLFHFDAGTFDFRLTKEALNKFNNIKIGKIQMGNFIVLSPNVGIAKALSEGMDGRFGWHVFDGRIVEIDYDKQQIYIYSQLPKIKKGFVKSDIRFIQSLFCIEANINIANQAYKGNFLFDTGSNEAMILDSAWMQQNRFPDNQEVIKKSSLSDGAGRIYETKIVLIPEVEVNGFEISSVPASKLGFQSPVGLGINYFGNGLLKRFNIIMDLQKDKIYLKPNSFYHFPFKSSIRKK